MSEAPKYGLRLMLSLVNNYKDFGGRPQYVQWARSAGVSVNSDDDFYTNPVVKGYYKNHVKVTKLTTKGWDMHACMHACKKILKRDACTMSL